ncbi:hypothetical protein R6Q59_036139 [Mikania micrantha]
MEIFEACGYHPEIGIKVLRQKALITIVKKERGGNVFDMHDLVEEMGHYIVRGEHPKNPRKHSRVWKREEIKDMYFGDATTHLPQLKVLLLEEMRNLQSTPDFHGLPRLQKLTLEGCYALEEMHPSFGSHTSLEYLNVSDCPKLRMFPTIVHMRNLKTLKICECSLKNGEIFSGIGDLSNLKELDLSSNNFSLLDFSISQLTCLKVLKLSLCDSLIELPDLPSSLVILKALYCTSLTTIGNSSRNCKWLSLVSLVGTNIVHDGERLLQSMLEGKGIENGPMLLLLPGLEIPMGFTPPLLGGSRYTLQLPENWRDNFSGFLMCAVSKDFYIETDYFKISVKQVSSCVSSEDDVFWEESDGDENTFVWYVSFDSLINTTWWDQTYKALSFDLEGDEFSGFGVRLVAKKNRRGLTETSTTNSYDYTPVIQIEHHKSSAAIMISSHPVADSGKFSSGFTILQTLQSLQLDRTEH